MPNGCLWVAGRKARTALRALEPCCPRGGTACGGSALQSGAVYLHAFLRHRTSYMLLLSVELQGTQEHEGGEAGRVQREVRTPGSAASFLPRAGPVQPCRHHA